MVAFRAACLAAVTLACGVCAHAAERATLRRFPPIAQGVAALPRLLAPPGDRAASRINDALEKQNQETPCGAGAGSRREYSRSVAVDMAGPRYLSVLVTQDWYCGGPYPTSGDDTPLVFDLRTGARPDWVRLLGASLAQKTIDYNRVGEGLIVSQTLSSIYQPLSGDDAQCRSALTNWPGGIGFMVWPDAAADALEVQPGNLPHVVAACGPPAAISAPRLRKLGVEPALLDAIDEAHRRGWYDKPAPGR